MVPEKESTSAYIQKALLGISVSEIELLVEATLAALELKFSNGISRYPVTS